MLKFGLKDCLIIYKKYIINRAKGGNKIDIFLIMNRFFINLNNFINFIKISQIEHKFVSK